MSAKAKIKWAAAIVLPVGAAVTVGTFLYGATAKMHEVNQMPQRVTTLEQQFSSFATNFAVIRLEWEIYRGRLDAQIGEILGSQRRQEEILKVIRNYMQIEINRQHATNR